MLRKFQLFSENFEKTVSLSPLYDKEVVAFQQSKISLLPSLWPTLNKLINTFPIIIVVLLQLGLLLGGFFPQNSAVIAKFLVCIILSYFLVFLLKKSGKSGRSSLHAFYDTFLLALNMCILFTCFVTFHDIRALLYVGGFLFTWLYLSERESLLVKILSSILWICVGFVSLQFHTFSFFEVKKSLAFFVFCALFVFIPLIFSGNKKFRLPTIILPSFILVEISLVYSLAIFSGENWTMTRRILKTPFIKPVVLYVGDNKLSEVLRKNPTRVVYEDCDQRNLFLFQREEPYGIIKINRDTGKALDVFDGAGVGDTAFMDCKKHVFYFPAYHKHKILVFSTKNITQPIRYYSLPDKCLPDHVLADEKAKKMFVACDHFNLLITINIESGIQEQVISKTVTMPKFYKEGHLLFQTEGMVYDYDYMHHKMKGLFRDEGHVHIDIDKGKNIIFANNPSGYVSFLEEGQKKETDKAHLVHESIFQRMMTSAWGREHDDKANIVNESMFQGKNKWIAQKKVTGRVYLEPMTRYIRFDSKRKLLFVTNYFRGSMDIIDTVEKKILHKVFVGTRVHYMTFSHDHDKLYFASNQGVFYLDLNKI